MQKKHVKSTSIETIEINAAMMDFSVNHAAQDSKIEN